MRAFHKLKPDETFIFHFRNDLIRKVADPTSGDGEPKRWESDNSPLSLLKKTFKRRAMSVAIIVFGGVAYVGAAPCSWQDPFNRKIGYRMALGRALRQAGRMYDTLGYHNSDEQYPFFDIDRRGPGVPVKTKLQWARALAEGINGGVKGEC